MLRRLTAHDANSHHSAWLALWVGMQLLALTVAALRVPLSARYPDTPEQLAVQIMLVVQTVCAAALAARLLATWRSTLAAAAMSWPMLYLAAVLSATPAAQAAWAGAYVSLWLVGLALWIGADKGPRWRMSVSAAALGVSLGGALLWYLRAEFARPEEALPWTIAALFGPTLGALAQVQQAQFHLMPWVSPAIVAVCGAIVRVAVRRSAVTPAD